MKTKKYFLKTISWILAGTLIYVLPTSCGKDDESNQNNNSSVDGLELNAVAEGLDTPWQMAFAPDGRIFFTQRPGKVSLIENGNLGEQPWLDLDSVVAEVQESGLTGIALDPQFAQNGYVYLAYTYEVDRYPMTLLNKIVRYKEDPQTKRPVFDKILIDRILGNYIHNIGQMVFGQDGKLYVGIGEVFEPDLAQNPNSLSGKILRINPDGSIPDDNPFPDSYIFTLGHRNPQGLAFNGNGLLFSTEHGPSEEQGCCRDELNLIEAGKNYGWPAITGNQTQEGMTAPVTYSGDTVTWAPTGATFLSQGQWKGSMLFTGLRGQALYRAVFDAADPKKVLEVRRYLYQHLGRLRDVKEGPDGTIYLAVSNYDGRGKPKAGDDKILTVKITDKAE